MRSLVTCFALMTLVLILGSCAGPQSENNTAGSDQADAETDAGAWVTLADGAWRAYGGEALPGAWTWTEEGALHFSGEGEGGDIVTTDQFADFELELEWKISPGGNSGIMFRVSEDHDYPWRTGPEYQILDDAVHPDALEGSDRLAGANYDVHAPDTSTANPAGEWNSARILARGPHVEHWLNGERVVSYELWSEDWKARIAESKWIDMPDYGMKESGHISLQDHGDPIWFRNVRIRRLAGEDS